MKRQELAPEIAEMHETPLTIEEFERRAAVRPSEDEIAELMSLVRWFTGRYPTVKERFAYVRRKYAEWTRNPPARLAEDVGLAAERSREESGEPSKG